MVSIVIVSYNQKNFLKQCLKNIIEADIGLDYEVIVVDNASKDGSKEFLSNFDFQSFNSGSSKNFRDFKVVYNGRNLGFAKANNQGIKLSQGKYLLLLNPDVIVLPGSVEKLVRFLENSPSMAMVGPQLLNPNGSLQYSCCRFPRWYTPILRRTFLGKLPGLRRELNRYLMLDWNHQEIKEVDWLVGAALMVRREILNRIGLLDERFFLYMEDVDLARRIKGAGFKIVYFPGSKMHHFHQRLSARHLGPALFSKVSWIHIISAIKYFWKWRGR